jgi:hypothetical protein
MSEEWKRRGKKLTVLISPTLDAKLSSLIELNRNTICAFTIVTRLLFPWSLTPPLAPIPPLLPAAFGLTLEEGKEESGCC